MDPNNAPRGNAPSSARVHWAANGACSSRSPAPERFSPSRDGAGAEAAAAPGRCPAKAGAGAGAGAWPNDSGPPPGAADWTQTPERGKRCRACPRGEPPQAPPLHEVESGCFRLQSAAGAARQLVPCPRAPACLDDPDASRQQFNAAFAVVASTAMLLAYKDFPVPDTHRKWTRDFLSLIKDDEGQVPPNIAGILWELDSTDPSIRARQAAARR